MTLLIDAARHRSARYFHAHLSELLLGEFAGLHLPLHPPTAAKAVADIDATKEFIRQWEGRDDVEYAVRNWSPVGLGKTEVPVRLNLVTIEQLVSFAQVEDEWFDLVARFAQLSDFTGSVVAGNVSLWRSLSFEDLAKASLVVDWFLEHPNSGLLKRAVAVEGVHTKWLENHRALIETLVADKRGEPGLGLSVPEVRVRLRFDVMDGPAGLTDIEVPLSNLSQLVPAKKIVMVENLDTFLSLPTWPGVVIAWGAGYRAVEIVRAPYFSNVRLLYWGDLDLDGFKILDAVRSRVPSTKSVLMNPETVSRWRYLGVPDRSFTAESFENLNDIESEALDQLITGGALRIEQERIRLDLAVEEIELAIGASSGL
ncbi:hypothetical protein N24_2890 [Corynebacterium suranareeae]|uniref:Wadjet protein JetD C-terminal domain-containing protein n=1 Tax=Corynebacterium suranareeae TaxID=2506452 RepID=A0A169S521_9CORY|nr:Wadjet anti-phage system protein JetD domain-containing protein [Corynebacterium suranareeae]BAU97152.1 hypothetical protein N24_2890 [Corynebacterium suranareeae]